MTWKTTAEELEKELNELKDKYDKLIEESSQKQK